MVRRDLTFRVFVGSTFSDLIAERNALQERAFPRLREYCQQKGARFQAIDLRWGVSEEAALDQQTMNICLQELKRYQKVSLHSNFRIREKIMTAKQPSRRKGPLWYLGKV